MELNINKIKSCFINPEYDDLKLFFEGYNIIKNANGNKMELNRGYNMMYFVYYNYLKHWEGKQVQAKNYIIKKKWNTFNNEYTKINIYIDNQLGDGYKKYSYEELNKNTEVIEIINNNYDINLFNLFDKLSKPPTNEGKLKIHRIRQFLTFNQLYLFDTFHDMIDGDRSNFTQAEKIRYMKCHISYYVEFTNQYVSMILDKQKMNTTQYIKYVKNNIYTYKEKLDQSDYDDSNKNEIAHIYMFDLFKVYYNETGIITDQISDVELTKYKNKLISNKTGANNSDSLGTNVSSIYPLQACEILGIVPITFFPHASEIDPSYEYFLYEISKQEENIKKSNKLLITIDISQGTGGYPTLGPVIGNKKFLGKKYKARYVITPGKLWDSTGHYVDIFNKDPSDIKTIIFQQKTGKRVNYNLYYKYNNIVIPFLECYTEQNGNSCELGVTQFCDINVDIFDNNDAFVPESSRLEETASEIKKFINRNDAYKKVVYTSTYKATGDLIQNVWHYIVGQIYPKSTNNLEPTKIHISSDTISAWIARIFGGVVACSNKQYNKLEGLLPGGDEVYFITQESFNTINRNKPVNSGEVSTETNALQKGAIYYQKDWDNKNKVNDNSEPNKEESLYYTAYTEFNEDGEQTVHHTPSNSIQSVLNTTPRAPVKPGVNGEYPDSPNSNPVVGQKRQRTEPSTGPKAVNEGTIDENNPFDEPMPQFGKKIESRLKSMQSMLKYLNQLKIKD